MWEKNQPRLTFDDVYKILKCGHSNKATEYCLLLGRLAIFYLEVQTFGCFDGRSQRFFIHKKPIHKYFKAVLNNEKLIRTKISEKGPGFPIKSSSVMRCF